MKDYLKQFNTTAEYNTYINGTPDLPNVSLTLDDNEVHYNKYVDYSREYLTFEALESGTFTLTVPSLVDSTLMTSVSYSTDDGANWTTTTINNTNQTITTPTINAGDKVLWKGEGISLSKYNDFGCSYFGSTGNFNVEGNIMSMIYGDNFQNQTTFPNGSENTFSDLFKNATHLINAENLVLPATTLVTYCYCSLFRGCTSLTTAPELPATTLASYCYGEQNSRGMFYGCTSLTTAPTLPATTLVNSCYQGMFLNCTALTTAPELPATTLANSCYNGMFYGCTNLNSITMLATNVSASNCLNNWVQGVAASGTFTKAASMTTLPSGASGIPENWTVVDE